MPLLTDYDDQPDIVIPIEEQPSLNSSNYPEVRIGSRCFKFKTLETALFLGTRQDRH